MEESQIQSDQFGQPQFEQPQQPQPQTAQYSSPVYQTSILTPGVIQNLVHDDSPVVVGEEFWEFLGVEIPVADIKDYDFEIVLLLVNQRFYNILEKYHEDQWDQIQIVEYRNKVTVFKEGEKEKEVVEKVPFRAYNLLELWGSIETKVRLKMYRGREGFTLDRLTTNRSFIKEEVTPLLGTGPSQGGKREGGWRFW